MNLNMERAGTQAKTGIAYKERVCLTLTAEWLVLAQVAGTSGHRLCVVGVRWLEVGAWSDSLGLCETQV